MTPDEAFKFIKESINKNYNEGTWKVSKPTGIKFIETPHNDIIRGITVDHDKGMITHMHLRGEIKQVTIKGTLSYE